MYAPAGACAYRSRHAAGISSKESISAIVWRVARYRKILLLEFIVSLSFQCLAAPRVLYPAKYLIANGSLIIAAHNSGAIAWRAI
jgi:hypothetical protein